MLPNWNLEVLIFEEEKTGVPGESEKLSTHMTPSQGSKLGYIGGKQVPSPLRHPCFPKRPSNVKKLFAGLLPG